MCWSPSGHRRIRDTNAWHRERKHRGPSELLRHRGRSGGGRFEDSRGAAASGAAKDVIGTGGYFQEDIDGGNERNQQYGKPPNELEGRDIASALQGEHTNNKVADDVDDRSGNHFIEGVLQEATQP